MKTTIEFLKGDRKVNSTFKEKLEKIGLEISYRKFSYWDGQPYVQIGRKQVFLVEEYYYNNSTGITNRYQNDVIEEIIETIENEKKRAEQSDDRVNDFFEKLGLTE